MQNKYWKASMLGNHVELCGGYGFPLRLQGCTESGIPFYKVSDMSLPGNERWLRDANNYVNNHQVSLYGWKLAPAHGIAFAKVGAALLLNRRRILTTKSLVDNNMMVAIAGSDIDPVWLFWWLQSVDFGIFVQPGVLPSVNQRQIEDLEFNLPPLPEQRRIAEILDTLDEAIRKSEQVIAKLQQIRQGLLHDLLTRGINKNGELRAPTTDICEKGWIHAPLGDLLYPVREPGMCGLPTVAVTLNDGLVPRDSNERRVHTELRPEQHLLVKSGDIAYNMMRMWQGACGIAEYDCMVSPAYVVLRMKLALRPRFAYLLFKSPEMIAAFLVHSRGITSDRYRLYPDDMLRIMAIIPSNPNEQERIADVADTFDARIQNEQHEAQKLHKIRLGLMIDLLTGKVCVNTTEEKPYE